MSLQRRFFGAPIESLLPLALLAGALNIAHAGRDAGQIEMQLKASRLLSAERAMLANGGPGTSAAEAAGPPARGPRAEPSVRPRNAAPAVMGRTGSTSSTSDPSSDPSSDQ